jgi:hypothetical protein
MSGWQPIETAPKDTRTVLIAWRGFVTTGFFCPDDGEWLDLPHMEQCPPTHWMPLPEPPEPTP